MFLPREGTLGPVPRVGRQTFVPQRIAVVLSQHPVGMIFSRGKPASNWILPVESHFACF
jgi:hypothetical protein